MAFRFAAASGSSCNQPRSLFCRAVIMESIEPVRSKPAPTNICSNQLHGNCSPARLTDFCPRSRVVPNQDWRLKVSLLISHTHWDHIQGLPFFSPTYNQNNLIRVLGYEGARAGLAKILASQMETPFFPVSLRELPSHLAIEELKEMEFQIGNVEVRSKFANHPGICAGYRLFTSSGSIAYFPDNEPYEQLKLQLASRDRISEDEAR